MYKESKMSIYNRDKSEWVGFKSGCLEVVEKIGEEDYQNKGNNGKVYAYKQDLLRVVCKCGKERTVKAKSFVGNKPESCRFCAKQQKTGIGERSQSLVCIDRIQERYPSGRSKIVLLCRCEKCGLEKRVKADTFRYESTGCAVCDKIDTYSSEFGQPTTPEKYYKNVKSGANRPGRKRSFDFDVSLKYVLQLLETQKSLCALTGEPISFKDGNASLDRIDSSVGYTEGNVQWVHRIINFMKSTMSQEQFIKWCFLVSSPS
jgi:hypothetical protein